MSTRFAAPIVALAIILAATGVHTAQQAQQAAKPPEAAAAPAQPAAKPAARAPATKAAAPASLVTSEVLSGLALRNIGPAIMSGRISDVVIHPKRRATWYVAVGSGGVWKTENAGTTWTHDLRRPGVVLDRMHRARPVEPRNRVGRHGRERQRAARRLRRRRLQEPQRRQDVDEHGAQDLGAHRPHPRGPAQLVGRLRRRRGAALVAGWRARSLQVHRWRQDVDRVPLHLERHRRHLHRDGSVEPRHPLRGCLPAPAHRRRVHGWRA